MDRIGIYAEGTDQATTTLLAPAVSAANVDEHLPELRFEAAYTGRDGQRHNEVVVIALSKTGLVQAHAAIGAILTAQNERRIQEQRIEDARPESGCVMGDECCGGRAVECGGAGLP